MALIDENDSGAGERVSKGGISSPNQFHVAMVGAALALIYVIAAPMVMHVSIRWAAPYWLAIAMSSLAISSLICNRWRHVLAGMLLGIIASGVTWFAEIGAYHVAGLKWVYSAPWPYLLKAPTYLLLGGIFLLGRRTSRIALAKAGVAAASYFALYFSLLYVAPFVCSLGSHSGGLYFVNYDDYGYRLGIFALAASFCSAMLARKFYSWKR